MDYGRLLSRAWNIVWEHKFLILLGVLVALGSGGGGGGSTGANAAVNWAPGEGTPVPEFPQIPSPRAVGPVVVILAVIAVVAIVVIGLAVWVVSTIARGGLIAGVNVVEEGGSSSFSRAWNAGWRKGWRLLGISLVPGIPALMLGGIALLSAAVYAWSPAVVGPNLGIPAARNLWIVVAALSCVLVPLTLVLGLLRGFADRACMLEDLGVFGSYRRGSRVLLDNLGPAVVLFLIQIAISIAIGIVGLLPGILLALCCVLWPLLILVQGAISAYFSTMWTLAWRRWTGLKPGGEVA
ncbi:MAG: hypothetical protein R6X31_15660, partial [Anaerolineae bacterium]